MRSGRGLGRVSILLVGIGLLGVSVRLFGRVRLGGRVFLLVTSFFSSDSCIRLLVRRWRRLGRLLRRGGGCVCRLGRRAYRSPSTWARSRLSSARPSARSPSPVSASASTAWSRGPSRSSSSVVAVVSVVLAAANVDTGVVDVGATGAGTMLVSPPRSPMKAWMPWIVAATRFTPTAGQFWMGLNGNGIKVLFTPGSPLQS